MAYIGKGLDNGVRNQFVFAATQGQTSFSGSDSDGKTLAMTDILYTDCYQNGVKLKPTTDYTVTSTTLTLVSAARVNDVINIVSFDTFAVPDTVSASTGGTFNGAISATSYGAVSGTTGTFTGNVGIGTTSTSSIRLQAVTPTANHVGLQVENSNTADSFGMIVKGGNDANDYTADFRKRDNTNIMRIRGDGNVGIGTTSPQELLHLKDGDIAVGNGTASNNSVIGRIGFSTDSSNSRFIGVESFRGSDAANADLRFHTYGGDGNKGERMRITTAGNVLVGTTTNVGANAKIFAKGSGVGIAVGYGTGSSEYRHLYMNSSDGTLYFFNDTNYANLSPSGAWTNASDQRIKKNIVDIKYGLEDVLKIQPRSYQMKEVSGDHIGLIAQEVEEIIPEVVSGDPEKQLCLNYGSLVAVAFKAIQEQQTVIESLKTRITALEAE